MKLIATLVMVMATLVACHTFPRASVPEGETLASPSAEIEFHGDVTFTPDERAVIEQAAHIWRQQTGGLASATIFWDLDFDSIQSLDAHGRSHVLVRRTSNEVLVMLIDIQMGCPGCILGWTTSDGVHNVQHEPVRMSLVVDRMRGFKGELLQTTIHELGHAFGIGHLDNRNAIMYPSVDPQRHNCLTVPDLRAFCVSNLCPGDTPLAPCE